MTTRIDVSDIEGTYCYCSEGSADLIRHRISGQPLSAIHLLGTGDYHYLTLFFLERITTDFALVLFDNHPDDQPGAFDKDLLTCGSWVRTARENLPNMKADIWNGSGTIPSDMAVYLSIDLDVLSREFARTDWDQGDYSIEKLSDKIIETVSGHRLIGVDICGGLKEPDNAGNALNNVTTDAICRLINQLLH